MKAIGSVLVAIALTALMAACPKKEDPNVPASVTPPPPVISSATPTR